MRYTHKVIIHVVNPTITFMNSLYNTLSNDIMLRTVLLERLDFHIVYDMNPHEDHKLYCELMLSFRTLVGMAKEIYVNNYRLGIILGKMTFKEVGEDGRIYSILGVEYVKIID